MLDIAKRKAWLEVEKNRNIGRGMRAALIDARCALIRLADLYRQQGESPIGEDYVLGACWLDMLKGLRGMLNGETGGIDCGAFDASLVTLARDNGFTDEDF